MEHDKKLPYTIKEIIEILDGDYQGELKPDHKIKGVSKVETNDINSLTFAENKSYIDKAVKKAKGLVLVNRDLDADLIQNVLYVKNARLAYAKVAKLFKKTPYYCPGIDKNAIISDSVKLGQNVSIHSNVVIRDNVEIGDNTIIAPGTVIDRDVKIGKNCLIYSNVVIERECKIKDNVTINSLSVIGSEGYGYVSDKSKHHHIPQLGNVVINSDVEIGANVTIDRGTQNSTVIGAGTKIDNQVQIAHNVSIGKNCLIVAQVGIAGSTIVGDNVTLAGKVGIIDHAKIGNNAIVGAGSIVTTNVPKGAFYLGNPAQERRDELKDRVLKRKLKEYRKRIREIEKKLKDDKD